jgi:hypothetical protein
MNYEKKYDDIVQEISRIPRKTFNIGKLPKQDVFKEITEKVPEFFNIEEKIEVHMIHDDIMYNDGKSYVVPKDYSDAFGTIELCLTPGEQAEVSLYCGGFLLKKAKNITGPFRFYEDFPTEHERMWFFLRVEIHNEDSSNIKSTKYANLDEYKIFRPIIFHGIFRSISLTEETQKIIHKIYI